MDSKNNFKDSVKQKIINSVNTKTDNRSNSKIDIKTLNELIKSGSILLKITLTMMILSIIAVIIYLFDKTSVIKTIGNIFGILSPLFIGLIIAWLLEPSIKYFVKNKVNRKLATFVVYLIFIFVIILIIALIVPEFVSQVNDLIIKIPNFVNSINKFINNLFTNMNSGDLDLTNMKDTIIRTITNFANNLASSNLTGLIEKLSSSIKVITDILLGLLIGFYLSLDFQKVNKNISLIIPKRFHEDLRKIKRSLNEMLRSYVNGTLLSCLFVMILSLIGFLISKVSSPLLFAIFCAITNLIPYFGPYIGGIPVVIVGLAIDPLVGLGCLITVVVVQFLEGNILHPLIVGKAISLHPITMVLSLLIFQYFFGILGMLLAAPIIATLKIIFNFLDEKYHFFNFIKEK